VFTVLLWLAVLCYLVLLYRSLSGLSASASRLTPLDEHLQDIGGKGGAPLDLLVLLQPSPVDGGNQIMRLLTIDTHSWGQWIVDSSRVALFAGLPPGRTGTSFQHIHSLPLSPPPPVEEGEEDKSKPTQAAYAYMLEQFAAVLVSTPRPFTWFTFANDHTFLVPDNLVCFLQRRGGDSDLPVYAGNILQRGMFRDVNLKFASGGAGAVLSQTALKLLVVTWVLTDNPLVRVGDLMKAAGGGDGCSVAAGAAGVVNLVGTAGKEFGCALMRIKAWLAAIQDGSKDQLTILVSPKIQLLASSGPEPSASLVVRYQTTLDHERGHTPVVKVLTRDALARCDAVTAWDRINPGLVVAYCIQHVYEGLVPSTSTSAAERFNVFGSLRTLAGDVDSWYTECKLNLPPGSLERQHDKRQRPLSVATDVVSFHYVSQKESILLYQLISRKLAPTPEELFEVWPKTDKETGHYSRKMRTIEEARALLVFVNQTSICSPAR